MRTILDVGNLVATCHMPPVGYSSSTLTGTWEFGSQLHNVATRWRQRYNAGMATFALTFNKVAADLHFDPAQVKGVRVKAQDGDVTFQPSATIEEGVWPLEERTRGGLGITLTGTEADRFLLDTGTQAGDHLILGAIRDGWITSRRHVPVPGQEKPSKIWPSARIWSITGAPEQDGSMPNLSFKLERAANSHGGYVFTASSTGAGAAHEARFRGDLLKLHAWCALHLSETSWELTATQSNTLGLSVVNGTVKSAPQGSEFQISLWVEGKEQASLVSLSV